MPPNIAFCTKCGTHFRMDAASRLALLLDGAYEQHDVTLRSSDPLHFVDSKPYSERLRAMSDATSLGDALISASGKLDGRAVNVCARLESPLVGVNSESCPRWRLSSRVADTGGWSSPETARSILR